MPKGPVGGDEDSLKISAMNLDHVSSGLKQLGVEETIHGVIGADILELGTAIIDYAGKFVYFKFDDNK